MREELDILDNVENILRIKKQIYENLSMHGIEIACDIRTSRVSDREAASYGLIKKINDEKSLHPVFKTPVERFFRFAVKICSTETVYIYAFIPSKVVKDPNTDVKDFLWMSNINTKTSKTTSTFTEFLKGYKKLSSIR